jgi:hypothetical protein
MTRRTHRTSRVRNAPAGAGLAAVVGVSAIAALAVAAFRTGTARPVTSSKKFKPFSDPTPPPKPDPEQDPNENPDVPKPVPDPKPDPTPDPPPPPTPGGCASLAPEYREVYGKQYLYSPTGRKKEDGTCEYAVSEEDGIDQLRRWCAAVEPYEDGGVMYRTTGELIADDSVEGGYICEIVRVDPPDPVSPCLSVPRMEQDNYVWEPTGNYNDDGTTCEMRIVDTAIPCSQFPEIAKDGVVFVATGDKDAEGRCIYVQKKDTPPPPPPTPDLDCATAQPYYDQQGNLFTPTGRKKPDGTCEFIKKLTPAPTPEVDCSKAPVTYDAQGRKLIATGRKNADGTCEYKLEVEPTPPPNGTFPAELLRTSPQTLRAGGVFIVHDDATLLKYIEFAKTQASQSERRQNPSVPSMVVASLVKQRGDTISSEWYNHARDVINTCKDTARSQSGNAYIIVDIQGLERAGHRVLRKTLVGMGDPDAPFVSSLHSKLHCGFHMFVKNIGTKYEIFLPGSEVVPENPYIKYFPQTKVGETNEQPVFKEQLAGLFGPMMIPRVAAMSYSTRFSGGYYNWEDINRKTNARPSTNEFIPDPWTLDRLAYRESQYWRPAIVAYLNAVPPDPRVTTPGSIVRSLLDFPPAAANWRGTMKVAGFFYSNPDKNARYKVGGLPVADNFVGLVGSRRFEQVPKTARVAQIAGADWDSLLFYISNEMAKQGVTA